LISVEENKCDFCGTCVAVCPVDAIELFEANIEILHDRCIDCDLCVWVCPIEVLHTEKPEMTRA